MKVSREELLHIANLSSLNLKEDEVDTYLLHLQDILNYANIVSKAPTEGLSEAVGVENKYNVFFIFSWIFNEMHHNKRK